MNTNVGSLVVKLNGDASNYQRMLGKAQAMTTQAAASISKTFSTKIQFGGISQMLAGAGIGAAIGQSVRLAAQAETTKTAFETMLGSGRAASKLMGEIEQFAASTPFEIPGLTTAARQLLAFGTQADQIVPTMRMLGDISAGVNMPIEELAELFGKAQVQGRMFQEDINQLTGRGIPIIGELAKQFGVAESEVRKLTESGQVQFGHIQQAFVNLTAEGSRFGGMMAKQSQTVAGQWSTLKDTVNSALRGIGQAIITNFDLATVIANTGKFVTFLTQSWQELGMYTINSWSLMFVSMYENLKFFFVEQAWPMIKLYPTWWWETFKLVLANAAEFGKALWRAVRGDGWEMHWQGYSEAFLAEVAKIPSQADRPLTEWEKTMTKDLDNMANQMGRSWNKAFADQQQAQEVELKLAPIVQSAAPLKELEKLEDKATEMQRIFDNGFHNNKAVTEGSDEMYQAMQLVAQKYQPREAPKQSWVEQGARAVMTATAPMINEKGQDAIVKELKELLAVAKQQLAKPVIEAVGVDL